MGLVAVTSFERGAFWRSVAFDYGDFDYCATDGRVARVTLGNVKSCLSKSENGGSHECAV